MVRDIERDSQKERERVVRDIEIDSQKVTEREWLEI